MGSTYPKARKLGACLEFGLSGILLRGRSEVKWGDVGVPYTQGNHLSVHVVSLGSVCPYRFHFSLQGPWELTAGQQQQGAFSEQLLA